MYSLMVTSTVVYETNYMYNYKGSSVVMLTVGRGGGTGFRVTAPSGDSYILTNNHICKDNKTLTARWEDQVEEIKVLEKYPSHDLCLLEDLEEIPSLDVAGSLNIHERVWLIGHPALRQLTLESGHFVGKTNIKLWTQCSEEEIDAQVEGFNPDRSLEEVLEDIIMLSAGYCLKSTSANHINNISYPGNSGSPVLNKWGNVVGVLFAGMRGQPTASYVVPLEDIQEFLKDR